ncbi:luciferase [Pseudoclavibacter endophyticus]|uniref:LLM class flavin-dependent oxidoreductase n=1 Tax=Pseudoclavibacter endophyticus TaxID=1778590 RepID=A0A6H9WNQ0_9MICO|nr:LLM class flavin-dependent oxidoreductase [Pseudoclavibacter endophyticus]KAB1648246.1 LLM class flavin-dependent oxidoreductase [Pseudoclavibacter endophyticus]GGA70970.1 luciferase [Pseudoclavibacter endophyticus]
MTRKDYGVFLPNAAGGWMISSTAPYPPADYDYNRQVALAADGYGLDFVMAMSKWLGFGGATDHWGETIDSLSLIAALAEATTHVGVWGTIHCNVQHPAFAAKIFTTLQQISHGRGGMNIVNGSYADEFRQMGLWNDSMSHADRYRMTEAWMTAVDRLWTEPEVTMKTDFFVLDRCQSRPHPVTRPTVVSAGRSALGRKFQAKYADAAFLGSDSMAEMREFARDVHDQAAAHGRTCGTYAMLTLVIGETDAAAERAAAAYAQGIDRVALANMRSSWGWAQEKALSWAEDAPGDEAFQTPYITGSPTTIAERVHRVLDGAELDGIMLIFPDYLRDLPVFGTEVLPLLRAADG